MFPRDRATGTPCIAGKRRAQELVGLERADDLVSYQQSQEAKKISEAADLTYSSRLLMRIHRPLVQAPGSLSRRFSSAFRSSSMAAENSLRLDTRSTWLRSSHSQASGVLLDDPGHFLTY